MLTRGKMARSFYDVIADTNREGKAEGAASVEAVMSMGRAAADVVASAATSLTGSGKNKGAEGTEEDENQQKKSKKNKNKLKLKRKKNTKVDASVAQGRAMRHGWDKAVVGTADNALRREKEFDAPRRNRKFRTSQSLTSETRSVSHRDYVGWVGLGWGWVGVGVGLELGLGLGWSWGWVGVGSGRLELVLC